MKFAAIVENVLRATKPVAKLANNKISVPVCRQALLTAEGGYVTWESTNLEISVSLKHGARVDIDGKLVVDIAAIHDFLSKQPKNERVDFSLEQGVWPTTKEVIEVDAEGKSHNKIINIKADLLTVEVGTRRIKIPIEHQVDDYPVIQSVPMGVSNGIGGLVSELDRPYWHMVAGIEMFRDQVERVLPAACKEDSRPVLTGILLRGAKSQSGDVSLSGKLTLASADGFRLHVLKTEQHEVCQDFAAIVPANSLKFLLNVLPKTGAINVTLDTLSTPPKAWFQFEGGYLVTSLIDGKFPDYEQIIPQGDLPFVQVNRAELLSALKSVESYARQTANTLNVECKQDYLTDGLSKPAGKMTVQAQSEKRAASEVDLPLGKSDLCMTGFGMKFAVNIQYLQEALSVLETEQARVESRGASHPMVVKSAYSVQESELDPDNFLAVIMPMSLNR